MLALSFVSRHSPCEVDQIQYVVSPLLDQVQRIIEVFWTKMVKRQFLLPDFVHGILLVGLGVALLHQYFCAAILMRSKFGGLNAGACVSTGCVRLSFVFAVRCESLTTEDTCHRAPQALRTSFFG